jgi:hypothetical protein
MKPSPAAGGTRLPCPPWEDTLHVLSKISHARYNEILFFKNSKEIYQ